MVLVAVLIEGDEKIRFIAGGENLPGAHADLEDRGPARDRGGDGHVGHDFLVAAAGQSGQQRAGSLDAILRISSQTDHRVVDVLRPEVSPSGNRYRCGSQFRGERREYSQISYLSQISG